MPDAKVSAKDSPYYSNAVDHATFVIGAETGGTTKLVTISLKDPNRRTIARRAAVKFYLSNDINGDSLLTTAHSGGMAINGGIGVAIEEIADKAGILISNATGGIAIDFVEAGAKTAYLILIMPDGRLLSSGAITHV